MSDITIFDDDGVKDIRHLQNMLNAEPDSRILKKNKWAGNSTYIPISHLEAQLDFIFPIWSWEIDEVTREQNHMIVRGHLTIHFKGQIFRKLGGVGARPFQVDKGAHFADFERMKPNAVEQSSTVAASYAFRNAAQKIGKLFGRDLNRNENVDKSNDALFTLKEQLESAKNVKELLNIWAKIPPYLRGNIRKIFTEIKNNLEKDVS